jgi:hypothetical protein
MLVYRDQVINFSLQAGDVEVQFTAPVINAVPVHGPFLEPEFWNQL